ncbi:MAG: hypothetical protein GX601_01360 [Anaerolineales bacterium]|nr:hypothetical protein [Anaerolineales bacterium]
MRTETCVGSWPDRCGLVRRLLARQLLARMLSFVTVLLVLCSTCPLPVAAQDLPPDRRFGAIEAFRDPIAAAEAGVAWERILFYWSELQPNGPDDWNPYHVPDEWLSMAAGAGREVVGLLKHTPQWATDGSAGNGVPRGLDLPVDDPNNLWAAFVRRTVERYAGRINHWIIWNEPDIAPGTYGCEWDGTVEQYYRLLKVAYLAAHQANPDVTIHLAGLTYWHDKMYLRRFLAVATQDPEGAAHGYYFDVVTLHIYFQTETVYDLIGIARAALTEYGLRKAIWLNETNAPPNSDPQWHMPAANYEISLEEQASFLLQSFALALAAGAERVAVYKWLDNDLQPAFEPFGVIRPDYSRRPAYDAFRLIRRHYAGAVSAEQDRQARSIVVTIQRGALTTRVAWARTQAETTLALPALAAQARLISQTGEERVLQPVNGAYVLTLPGARCADKRGCIIGGSTYLLIEEAQGAPPPASEVSSTPDITTTAELTSSVTPTTTLTTETITQTVTVQPSETPSPTPPSATSTLRPTRTSSPTPTRTPTATPTPSATPTAEPTDEPTAPPPSNDHRSLSSGWAIGLGVAGVMLLTGTITLMVRQRAGRKEPGG